MTARPLSSWLAPGTCAVLVGIGAVIGVAARTAWCDGRPRLTPVATIDDKTGLLTTTAWGAHASRELDRARRRRADLSVLVVDLDRFKLVNDRFGHLVGDRVLVAAACALARAVRPGDVISRFGGDEFLVLLRDTAPADAVSVAGRIRDAIAAIRVETGASSPLRLSASVGVAGYPGAAATVPALLDAADRALYAAKHAGRDTVAVAPESPACVRPPRETSRPPMPTIRQAGRIGGLRRAGPQTVMRHEAF